MSLERRRQLIEPGDLGVSIMRECRRASISRSAFHHRPVDEMAENLALMPVIDAE